MCLAKKNVQRSTVDPPKTSFFPHFDLVSFVLFGPKKLIFGFDATHQ